MSDDMVNPLLFRTGKSSKNIAELLVQKTL